LAVDVAAMDRGRMLADVEGPMLTGVGLEPTVR
jgi:hypothetical protein